MNRNDKIITREKLFEEKKKLHKEQAKLSFEEKIKMLIELQTIAGHIKEISKKQMEQKAR